MNTNQTSDGALLSPPPCSDWFSRNEAIPEKQERILVFSPVYPVGDVMRYRLMDSRFFCISKEGTHWMSLDPNANIYDN